MIVDCYMGGRITRAMPLDKINDAFELMPDGESTRSVVHY